MRYRYLVSLALSMVPLLSSAETIEQRAAQAENLGIYGGEVRDAAFDTDNNMLYITTYSASGFFRSSDNGATWRGLDTSTYDLGEPRGVELDDDNNVYILMTDGVFKSTDQGTSFTDLGLGESGAWMLFANNVLYVAMQDGTLARSTDGGATFTTSTISTGRFAVSLAASSDTVYAVMDDGSNSLLMQSTDQGATWSESNDDDVSNSYVQVAVDPDDDNHLILTGYNESDASWQTYDGGNTWNSISGVTFAPSVTWDSTGRIYIGVKYSDNNGSTWQEINATTPSSRVSGYVWPNPTNVNELMGASFGAIALSNDRGATWTDANTGITAVTVKDMAQSNDKQTVWAATNAGLAKTENFLSETPTWEFPIYYDSYPQSVWVDPSDANHVVVGGLGNIYQTVDGGDHWTTSTGWDTDFTPYQIRSNPTNNAELYAAGAVQSLSAGREGGVYRSTDGGTTWTSLNLTNNLAVQTIAVATDGTVYVGAGILAIEGTGTTGVYKYNGSSWSELTGAPDEEITQIIVDRSDDNTLYLTATDFSSFQNGHGGVYKSIDAGETWTRLETGLEDAARYLTITQQTSTNKLYMAGTDIPSGKGAIWKSDDGGATWGITYRGLQSESFGFLMFDGLMVGNERGAYDIKTRGKFVIERMGNHFMITLKDGATLSELKHKKVSVWKKVGGDWTRLKVKTTSRNGKVEFHVRGKVGKSIRFQFKPTGNAVEEFAKTNSKTFKLK